jgi:hypothetical protein
VPEVFQIRVSEVVILRHAVSYHGKTATNAVSVPLANPSDPVSCAALSRPDFPSPVGNDSLRSKGQKARTVFHTVRCQEEPAAHRVNGYTVRAIFQGLCPSRRARVKLRRVAGFPRLSALRLCKPGDPPG